MALVLPELYKFCKWVSFRGPLNPLPGLPCWGKRDKEKAMLPLKFVALSLGLVKVKDCTSRFAWTVVSVELRAVRAPGAPATSVTWPLLGR